MNLMTSARPGAARRSVTILAGLATAVLLAACSPSAATPAATQPAAAASTAASAAPGTSAVPDSGVAASAGTGTAAASASLACSAPARPTTAQTEGPYFKAGSPQAATLVTAGTTGQKLTLTGFVVNTSCQPLANAKVDIWQADASGVYDNSGYRLRGYILADAAGRFTIETIIPGQYPGRTEHIHVKVTPAGGATLTTQLYFPGESTNTSDGIFSPDMLLTMTPAGSGYIGTFTFVLRA